MKTIETCQEILMKEIFLN